MKDGVVISSVEYKVRTVPANGNYSFITGGDMSTDENAEKISSFQIIVLSFLFEGAQLIKLAAATNPNFAIIGGDNGMCNLWHSVKDLIL